MDRINDIIIAGVGGQGVILAGTILTRAFLTAGFDVKQAEIHGMAQRGGSVESFVRRGEKV
ncbi:MAG: 2-oxoacid:acceptor oxidoreductase family protein, partial [Firmicutes bacterium]|nr:2-oxoacid:acceptor oxidoreductase family protein [Bacillota bacterium]